VYQPAVAATPPGLASAFDASGMATAPTDSAERISARDAFRTGSFSPAAPGHGAVRIRTNLGTSSDLIGSAGISCDDLPVLPRVSKTLVG